jgi:hypothetical protein
MSIALLKHLIVTYGVQLTSLGISLIALVISIFSILKTQKAVASTKRVGDRSRSAKHSAQQSIELTMNALISLNRSKMEESEHTLKVYKEQHPDERDEFREKIYMNSVEEYLKTFDNACLLYLEDRFDKDRFIKDYRQEIRKIIEKEHLYVKIFDNPEPIKSKYRAIQRVYDKWENIEK